MSSGIATLSPKFSAAGFLCSIAVNALSLSAFAEDEIDASQLAFFEKKVRPLLITHCYDCHSEEAGKRKGGLWLDRKDGWKMGGDSGATISPHLPEDSLLIHSIRYEDPDLEMPPDGKLPQSAIDTLVQWVQMGAPDPRLGTASAEKEGMSIEEGKQFWSFLPIRNPEEPTVKDRNWPLDPIDSFVLARLEGAGLQVAQEVPSESLLRRVKIDLTGLQPTLAEQNEFLQKPDRNTLAAMVDRWLNSAEFGERWGRHWLDLARYADSSGGGRAMPLPEAWRFRDYVIDAFEKDFPLDQLIRSHIAGDLLPFSTESERIDNLISTGFLVLGPHNYELQNKQELDLEIADEQMDTLGRAFLGMTIGCARCHDHKFDPIPTRDYYAMAGIFLSTNSVTHANVSKWHTEPIPPTEEIRIAAQTSQKQIDGLQKKMDEIKKDLATLGVGAGGSERSVRSSALRGIVVDDEAAEKVGEWMKSVSNPRWVDLGYIHDKNERKGAKKVIFTTEIEEAGRYELRIAYSAGSNRNPSVAVDVETKSTSQSYSLNQKLDPEHDRLFQSIAEFEIKEKETIKVIVSNRNGQGVVIADAIQWMPMKEQQADPPEPNKEEEKRISELQSELSKTKSALAEAKKQAPSIPEAMSVVDLEAEKIGPTELRIRGVESNKGEPVPRGFLQVASGWYQSPPQIASAQSGRKEFADWLVDSRNPLTARVLANRIWMHLIGQGIVTSADNFGVTGREPTHPELLDHLAYSLIHSGWSTKSLIRRIVLSRVYSIDSQGGDPRGPELDSGNHLLWKAHRRSLDAETMRDAMLAVSASLDVERGGPSLPKGFKSEFGYNFSSQKRSVYIPVFRNAGYEMFRIFDFANPNFSVGQRNLSTIPTQALFLTNSPLIHEYATRSTQHLLNSTENFSEEKRIEHLFRSTLARLPSKEEKRLAREFLARFDPSGNGNDDKSASWTALQKSLFACVDFRFLR